MGRNGSGIRIQYFTGKRRSKYKAIQRRWFMLSNREQVMFRANGKILVGFVEGENKFGKPFTVSSEPIESTQVSSLKYTVTSKDGPRRVLEGSATIKDMAPGNRALMLWDNTPGEFAVLKPVTLVAPVCPDVWLVKPLDHREIKTDLATITSCPYPFDWPMLGDYNATNAPKQEDINLVNLYLDITLNAVDCVDKTHDKTRDKIAASSTNSSMILQKDRGLDHLFQEAKHTVSTLRQDLFSSVLDNTAKLNALKITIHEHKAFLARYQKDNTAVKSEIHDQKRQKLSYRLSGNPISVATARVLENRAADLYKILETISHRSISAEEDLVSVLGAHFISNPDHAYLAFKNADTEFSTQLTAGQALDLKLLLHLPMQKFCDLRTYLVNHGIRVLAGDSTLYNELTACHNFSTNITDIGSWTMMKTTSDSESSSVAYIRVMDIASYLSDVFEIHEKHGYTWNDGNFNDELWIKIGGDKGCQSTKLAAQIVNVQKPNCVTTETIALYEACNTYTNMQAAFNIYGTQCADLQRSAKLVVGGVNRKCRMFLFGDYTFLTKIFGHMGPAAIYPCIWCYIRSDQCQNTNGEPHSPKLYNEGMGEWEANPTWPKHRTPDEITQDLADNNAEERHRGDKKLNSRYYHSIYAEQIIPILTDLKHVVPPVLHIILGLTGRFYKQIEQICRLEDRKGKLEKDDELLKKWEDLTVHVCKLEEELKSLKEEADYRESMLQGFSKCRDSISKRGCDRIRDKCSYPACALFKDNIVGVDERDIKWVECGYCGNKTEEGVAWYHVDCIGLKGTDWSKDGYANECVRCKGTLNSAEDVAAWQNERVEIIKGEVEQKKRELADSQMQLQYIYEEVKTEMGDREKMLNRILEDDLKVKKTSYHSQCFVRNHWKKILDHSDTLLQVLEGTGQQGRYSVLLGKLRHILTFTEARFLSQSEIKDLCLSCWWLGILFPKMFPHEPIPANLHILVAHVPECAMTWRTIGLLSEHGLESLHDQVSDDDWQYCDVGDNEERLKLVVENHGKDDIHVSTAPAVKKIRRVCRETKDCGGRYAFDENEERRCKNCKKLETEVKTEVVLP